MKNARAVAIAVVAVLAVGALFYAASEHAVPVQNEKTESIEAYVKENISTLSPIKEEVGGKFYVTQIEAHGGAGTVSYEDGHNAYTADFVYTADEKGTLSVQSFVVRAPVPNVPQKVTVTGVWECLPHKDRTGPQTLECAFGIAGDQSDAHYAIDTQFMARHPVDYVSGTHVRVSGLLTPVAQLNSIQRYDIDGIISARSIEEIE